MHLATTGRQGPALIDLPIDLQKAVVDTKLYGYDPSVNSIEVDYESTDLRIEKILNDFEKIFPTCSDDWWRSKIC